MPNYCGKDFVVQIGNGGSPETFQTVAAMQATSFTLANETVDVTNKDEMPWRQLFNCGVRSASVSANGFFTDHASLVSVQTAARNGTILNYTIISGRGDKYVGAFQITSFERNGEYNGAEQFSISLESSGEVVYTAAP